MGMVGFSWTFPSPEAAQIFGFPGVSADAWPFTHPALSEVGGRFSLGGGRYECYTTGFSLNTFFVGGDFF